MKWTSSRIDFLLALRSLSEIVKSSEKKTLIDDIYTWLMIEFGECWEFWAVMSDTIDYPKNPFFSRLPKRLSDVEVCKAENAPYFLGVAYRWGTFLYDWSTDRVIYWFWDEEMKHKLITFGKDIKWDTAEIITQEWLQWEDILGTISLDVVTWEYFFNASDTQCRRQTSTSNGLAEPVGNRQCSGEYSSDELEQYIKNTPYLIRIEELIDQKIRDKQILGNIVPQDGIKIWKFFSSNENRTKVSEDTITIIKSETGEDKQWSIEVYVQPTNISNIPTYNRDYSSTPYCNVAWYFSDSLIRFDYGYISARHTNQENWIISFDETLFWTPRPDLDRYLPYYLPYNPYVHGEIVTFILTCDLEWSTSSPIGVLNKWTNMKSTIVDSVTYRLEVVEE